MAPTKETAVTRSRDPFALIRQMTTELDRIFNEQAWSIPGWPAFSRLEANGWFPRIDVVEKDGRLVTKIDLPGMKKQDIKVEVSDGQLSISGERKSEAEEKKENFYRCEREYGSFSRVVPLPEGVTLGDVKATFADGVLEVSVPLPAKAEAQPKQIEIQEAPKAAKAA